MLLNFGMPKIPATTVQSNTPAFDPYAAVGFNPSSQYEGFMQQGNNNLYLKDGGLYQSYTPSPARYFYMGFMNQPVYYNPNNIMGMGSPSMGGISNRWQMSGGAEPGTIYSGDQAFRPYQGETPFGFVKTGDDYSLSTVALNSLRPSYRPTTNLGYNPAVSLLAPTAGGQGAGRFLGGDANMSLNFSAPTGE
jgi:hypothetical protein